MRKLELDSLRLRRWAGEKAKSDRQLEGDCMLLKHPFVLMATALLDGVVSANLVRLFGLSQSPAR